MHATQSLNVLGEPLQACGSEPLTGFYRDGDCRTGGDDAGIHILCAEMTSDFLSYTRQRGNDLVTPRPEYGFPGLKPGDRWCLCIDRWIEAFDAGVAPPVILAATHISALEFVRMQDLTRFALDSET